MKRPNIKVARSSRVGKIMLEVYLSVTMLRYVCNGHFHQHVFHSVHVQPLISQASLPASKQTPDSPSLQPSIFWHRAPNACLLPKLLTINHTRRDDALGRKWSALVYGVNTITERGIDVKRYDYRKHGSMIIEVIK